MYKMMEQYLNQTILVSYDGVISASMFMELGEIMECDNVVTLVGKDNSEITFPANGNVACEDGNMQVEYPDGAVLLIDKI